MGSVAVMHVLDALRVGGAERAAVNLANLLPQAGYETFLCSTREEGPFASLLRPNVGRLALFRKGKLDIAALRKAAEFVRAHNIRILHAHASALFFARLISMLPPYPALIWHDHYGRYMFNDRRAWLYRCVTRDIAGVIAVNEPLAAWSRDVLGIPAERVKYVPNLVECGKPEKASCDLPGEPGKRIVCVANIRPQKDHETLLKAMTVVSKNVDGAHLLLVGDFADADYKDSVVRRIHELGLDRSVTYLGRREDVSSILAACDLGVLSSLSEGLPISLLEYGAAGLPAIATNVGQCSEVLADGVAGILVPPSSPEQLAQEMIRLLESPTLRQQFGARLRQHVESLYSPEPILELVSDMYRRVLSRDRQARFSSAA